MRAMYITSGWNLVEILQRETRYIITTLRFRVSDVTVVTVCNRTPLNIREILRSGFASTADSCPKF